MTSIQNNKPTAELLNFLEIKDVYYKISDYLSLPELFTLEKVSKEFQRYITSRANEFIPLSFSIFSTSLNTRFFGSNNQELNEICKSVQTTHNQENLKSLLERMMKPTAQRLITATQNTEALHKTEKPAVVNDVFTILAIQKRTNPLFNIQAT